MLTSIKIRSYQALQEYRAIAYKSYRPSYNEEEGQSHKEPYWYNRRYQRRRQRQPKAKGSQPIQDALQQHNPTGTTDDINADEINVGSQYPSRINILEQHCRSSEYLGGQSHQSSFDHLPDASNSDQDPTAIQPDSQAGQFGPGESTQLTKGIIQQANPLTVTTNNANTWVDQTPVPTIGLGGAPTTTAIAPLIDKEDTPVHSTPSLNSHAAIQETARSRQGRSQDAQVSPVKKEQERLPSVYGVFGGVSRGDVFGRGVSGGVSEGVSEGVSGGVSGGVSRGGVFYGGDSDGGYDSVTR
ncbi:hypothetical protein FPOAC1_005196 [Fusarium poae]|uniref:hypothetical protein n=1 Tax=Fusarium poae TaxID=36050 RepID=UPI001CE72102|nr:hypothetical protein FPOAC1_005196 [Fusarium poae]KAG8671938.1 hypothetical protein FPOAC1_005196 [Fusarium poae]